MKTTKPYEARSEQLDANQAQFAGLRTKNRTRAIG